MATVEDAKINNAAYIKAIYNRDVYKVTEMHFSGHIITDLNKINGILHSINYRNSEIKFIEFFVNNILMKSDVPFRVGRIHPDITNDILTTLIDKGAIFNDSVVYNLLTNGKYRSFLIYFVTNYVHLPDYVKNKLQELNRKSDIEAQDRTMIRVCLKYFSSYVPDELLLKISVHEIFVNGEISTVCLKYLNVSEVKVIECLDKAFNKLRNKMNEIKFIELLLFLKTNINMTYNIIKCLSRKRFDEIIFNMFGDILNGNLSDYFTTIISHEPVKIDKKLINIFYNKRNNDETICRINTFILLTKKLVREKITFDDLMYIYENEKNLKQKLLLNAERVFDQIGYTVSTVNFLIEIYPSEVISEYIIKLLLLSSERNTKQQHEQIIKFVFDKYSNIETLYQPDELIDQITINFKDDSQFASLFCSSVANCKSLIVLSEKNIISLIDHNMCKTINLVVDLCINNPLRYQTKNIFDAIINKCRKIREIYNSSTNKKILFNKCYSVINLLKYIMNGDVCQIDNLSNHERNLVNYIRNNANINYATLNYLDKKNN